MQPPVPQQYVLIKSDSPLEFIEKMNLAVKNGCIPIGGLIYHPPTFTKKGRPLTKEVFAQAAVHYNEKTVFRFHLKHEFRPEEPK